MRGSARYSKDRKAEAVAILQTEANGSYQRTQELTGVGRETVRTIAKDPEIAELAQVKIKELGLKFLSLSDKILDKYHRIADSADFTDKSNTVLGISTEKALLCLGQPNQIVQQQTDAGPYLKQLISRGFGEDEAKMILEEAERRRKEYGS